ncbi:MAG: DUF4261 domain-containing protein [Ruminococcus sp.]|jgi:hypothetical protein|nr:DUF4261 domain-containing protein [Ruminococcus sp.]
MIGNKFFLGFVLLREAEWDQEAFFGRLKDKWGIVPEDLDTKDEEKIFVFNTGGYLVSLAFYPSPIPDGEAEQNAAFNYLWHDAQQEVSKHTAQIVVSVGNGMDTMERAKIFVKVCESCIDDNTIGIYTNGTVYAPDFYQKNAEVMKSDALPLLDFVWLGLSNAEGKLRGYTMGMENFKKLEMEFLEFAGQPHEFLSFMLAIVSYVIEEDVILNDGETIGFTEDQKLKITISDGIEFDDRKTIQIHCN